MRIALTTTPTNIVTEADPDLTNGSTYYIQNIGHCRVFYTIAADSPVDFDHYLDPGDDTFIEVATATPPWFWGRHHTNIGVSDG